MAFKRATVAVDTWTLAFKWSISICLLSSSFVNLRNEESVSSREFFASVICARDKSLACDSSFTCFCSITYALSDSERSCRTFRSSSRVLLASCTAAALSSSKLLSFVFKSRKTSFASDSLSDIFVSRCWFVVWSASIFTVNSAIVRSHSQTRDSSFLIASRCDETTLVASVNFATIPSRCCSAAAAFCRCLVTSSVSKRSRSALFLKDISLDSISSWSSEIRDRSFVHSFCRFDTFSSVIKSLFDNSLFSSTVESNAPILFLTSCSSCFIVVCKNSSFVRTAVKSSWISLKDFSARSLRAISSLISRLVFRKSSSIAFFSFSMRRLSEFDCVLIIWSWSTKDSFREDISSSFSVLFFNWACRPLTTLWAFAIDSSDAA